MVLQLSFNIFIQPSTLDTIRTNCIKLQTIDPETIGFPEKGLGLVSLSHFVYDFSAKMFLMLYSIN